MPKPKEEEEMWSSQITLIGERVKLTIKEAPLDSQTDYIARGLECNQENSATKK